MEIKDIIRYNLCKGDAVHSYLVPVTILLNGVYMENKITNILRVIYAFIVILIFAQFIYYQISTTSSESFFDTDVTILNQGYLITQDGKKELSSRNLNFLYKDAKPGEKIEIVVPLPQNLGNDQYIAILSNQQDLWLFVDDELIKEYIDTEERVLVEYSASNIVMVPLSEDYSGKDLKIVYYTILKSSASKLNCPVIGTEKNIICQMIYNNVGQLLSAMLLLALGVVLVVFDVFFKWNHGKDKGIMYLGIFSILVSVWLLCSTNLRVFYFRHMSSADLMLYITLMFCPIPMLEFFNTLMKKQHQKIYQGMIFVALLNILVNLTAQLTGIANIIDILVTTHVTILLTCGVCLVTFLDYSKKKDNELADAKAVMIGLIGFITATFIEDINIIFFNSSFVGRYLGLGILFLLMMLAYAAIRGMVLQEQDYQKALHANLEKSTFLATMSHEIRTPINTILGMDEMILRETKDDEILHYADNIKNAGKTLLSIINDILDFTKMESGKMELTPVRYNFIHLLNNLISSVSIKMKEKGLELILEIDENIPRTLLGDEVRINQAILNILINAVKYTKQGSITLKVIARKHSLDETDLYLVISDTGIGIKPEDKDKVYSSFVRLEENRNRSIEGTGLGMAITKQIIDNLNGDISFESEYGKGTTFYIHFRQKVLDEEPIGKIDSWLQSPQKEPVTYVEQYKVNLKLLVVDDNEMNLEVIKGLLRRTEASIDTAASGKECIQLFSQNEYDMILLDHMMPEMDGVETLRRLQREMDRTGNRIPVVALTANAIAGAREEYIQMGFSYYISKPVEYKALIEVMKLFFPERVEQREMVRTKQDEYSEYLENHGIHMSASMKYVGDDIQQYIHLLELFASERVNEKKAKLHDAYRKQRWEDYLVSVHALKNSARTIGANRLADMAYEHEQNCKMHYFVFIIDHYEELIYEWNETIRVIRCFLNKEISRNTYTSINKGEISEEEWGKNISQLVDYMNQFKKREATLLIQKMEAYSLDEKKRELIQKISDALSEYDYDKAREYIDNNE